MGRPGQTRDDNDDLDMEAAMTPQQEQPPRTDALRAALDYLRDKLLDQHQHSQQWIEEAFREADARLAATPSLSNEPHEDSEQAEVAAKVLGSQWHDHKIETETQRFIWRHRHEAATPSPSSAAADPVAGLRDELMEAMDRIAKSKVKVPGAYQQGWIDALKAMADELAALPTPAPEEGEGDE